MSEKRDDFLNHLIGSPFASLGVGRIGVAVSGGGDSMALLCLVTDWAKENGAVISAVTVDHGLRPEAAAEAAGVAAFCAARRTPHEVLRWDGWDGKGNVQSAARAARYRLIAGWAKANDVEAVCLGHTRDDQAETFLMRLARKAGSDGLRGMADTFEREGVQWLRPLLQADREDLRGYLRRQDVAWVEDPSNEDRRFDRVKARQAMAALGPLGIDAGVLSAVAQNLSGENALIRETVRNALAGQVEAHMGALCCGETVFAALHPEIRRRFLMAAVQWIGGGDYKPRLSAVSELETALQQGDAHTVGGVIGWVSKGRVWLAREYERVREARGTPFDGRWQIDGVTLRQEEGRENGQEIRALGPNGLQQLGNWRDLGLPRRALLPLPAVWEGENLVCAPLLDAPIAGLGVKATDLRPSFDKWLMQH
ncbi:tRNA lysidine(34) synthetase TilS [Rhodobacteraceae bacterium D3-12]|nr:tRNA lysidine(34) synthetase TilS [Rhodobacteraceae bacterium D3-12]